MTAFRTTFVVLALLGGVWLTAIGAVLYAVNTSHYGGAGRTIADGSILMTVLALALIINAAIVAPGLLMLQPFRLWRVARNERRAITPRQRFRGMLSPSFRGSSFPIAFAYLPPFYSFFFSDWPWGRDCIEVDPCSDRPFTPIFTSRLSWGVRPSVRDVVLHPRYHFRIGICSNSSVGRTGCDLVATSDAHW